MTWLGFLLLLVALSAVVAVVDVALSEWVSRRPERPPDAQPGGETRGLYECNWPGRCECGRCGERRT